MLKAFCLYIIVDVSLNMTVLKEDEINLLRRPKYSANDGELWLGRFMTFKGANIRLMWMKEDDNAWYLAGPEVGWDKARRKDVIAKALSWNSSGLCHQS